MVSCHEDISGVVENGGFLSEKAAANSLILIDILFGEERVVVDLKASKFNITFQIFAGNMVDRWGTSPRAVFLSIVVLTVSWLVIPGKILMSQRKAISRNRIHAIRIPGRLKTLL